MEKVSELSKKAISYVRCSVTGMNKSKNLLLITFDQWRGDWAVPGEIIPQLNTLHKIAEKSIVAKRCYTSSPHCVPARFSWLTGLCPSQMGITKNEAAEMPKDAPSCIRELQKSGWHTELIGKTHWTNHRESTDLRENRELLKCLGFHKTNEIGGPKALRHVKCELTDLWEEYGLMEEYKLDLQKRYKSMDKSQAWTVRPSILPRELYPDLWVAAKGEIAVENMPHDQPWFLWISFVGPHEPFDTPKDWNITSTREIPRTANVGAWIKELPDEACLKKSYMKWNGMLNNKDIIELRKDYANHLWLLDEQIKKLLDALEKRNDTENTALAITSDHGEMLGDHGMLYKGTFLEPSIRVPFIYKPAPNEQIKHKWLDNPIGLTNAFHKMIGIHKNNKSSHELAGEIEKNPHVCVEFDNELLIIKKGKKLCLNKDGESIWATNVNKDPQEQNNLIETKIDLLRTHGSWSRLMQIGGKEIKKRASTGWMWRDCKLHNN